MEQVIENFVFVDEERDEIRVYDAGGELDPETFAHPGRGTRRALAEAYAQLRAVELGCDWGTNY